MRGGHWGGEYRMGLRLAISVISGFGWLAFLVIWLFFYAETLSIYKNIAIFLLSILIVGAINAVTWIPWRGRPWED